MSLVQLLSTIDDPTAQVMKAISVGDRTELRSVREPLPWREIVAYIAAGEASKPRAESYSLAIARTELRTALERLVKL